MAFKSFLSKAKDIDILSSLPDGAMLINNAGQIDWMNDVTPHLLKIEKSKIFKSHLDDIIESGLELAKQSSLSLQSVVGRVNGDSVKDLFVEITAKAVDEYLVVSIRDVTQSYKTVTNIIAEHETSKKVNKDKNAFLVKLSNEIKSPIHSIIGFSQAMVDGLGGEMSDKQEKYIRIINKNSNEMLYLLDKILDLSKTESNLLDFDFQIFDVANTILTTIKKYEQQVKDKNLNLTFDSEELVKKTVFSDENSIKTILENILEVSINTTDIGSISVKAFHPELEFLTQKGFDINDTCTDKSYIMLTVSDTGAGFSENDLSVIFEPYAQLDRPNKKNIVRSIALACAKNLVIYLKGMIWIDSKPMQGATYNIILPIEKGG